MDIYSDLNKALNEFGLALPFSKNVLNERFHKLITAKNKSKNVLDNYNFLKAFIDPFDGLSISSELLTKWENEEKNTNNVFGECPYCKGSRIETTSRYVEIVCPNCNGPGIIELKCKFCDNGIYKGKKKCTACHGTGTWKTVRCNECNRGHKGSHHLGNRVGYILVEIPGYRACSHCKGRGKNKLELFNPVLKPNTPIMEEIRKCILKKSR